MAAVAVSPAGAQEASPQPQQGECQVEPRSVEEVQALVATPMAGTPVSEVGSPTVVATPEGGQPADQATVDGVTATYRELVACLNAGDFLRVYALYTEEYLQTHPQALRAVDELAPSGTPVVPAQQVTLVAVEDVMLLPDGRASAIAVTSAQEGEEIRTLGILEQVGDRWLIDEETVVEAPESSDT